MARFATRIAVLLLVLVTGSWMQAAACQIACDAPVMAVSHDHTTALSHDHAMSAQDECCEGSSATQKALSPTKCAVPAVWDVTSSADHTNEIRFAAQHAVAPVATLGRDVAPARAGDLFTAIEPPQHCLVPLRI